MSCSGKAKVWCYYDKKHPKRKLIFDPLVSNRIECKYSKSIGNNQQYVSFPVYSKKSQPPAKIKKTSLVWDPNFEINLQHLQISNKSTGDSYRICREICDSDSVFSQGYVWVVKGEGEWIHYDFDTSQEIEKMLKSRTQVTPSIIDLTSQFRLPYVIDVMKKIQKNIHTRKERPIKRMHLSTPYADSLPASAAQGANQQGASYSRPAKKTRVSASARSTATFRIKPSAVNSSVLTSTSSSSGSTNEEDSVEEVTESLPRQRSVKISSDASETKSASDIEKFLICVTDEVDEDCLICMGSLCEASGYGEGDRDDKQVVKLANCEHFFHKLCLAAMYGSDNKEHCLECPTCKKIYGEKRGNCPPGEMRWEIVKSYSIPGYEGYDVIRMIYFISPGKQGPGHPSPGMPYRAGGFPREGFLPDCNKGRRVLKLLLEAFRRKLMFTIGTSVTTGVSNTITWNEIHLKTEPTSNYSGHGYPDPEYLDNLLMELSLQGVTEGNQTDRGHEGMVSSGAHGGDSDGQGS